MKLLLTSGGITNDSIAKALWSLIGKKPEETSLVFVPTASNVEIGNKDWLIDDLINLKKQNFKQIDIADISAVPEKIWKQKFEAADVMFFEGGDEYHLIKWINESGLVGLLPELLKTRVYVGLSAGSMVASKDLAKQVYDLVYEDDHGPDESVSGLGFVNFYFMPHLNSQWFPKLREENIRKAVSEIKDKVYALDDQSAIKIDGENFEIISEGEWLEFN